MSRASTSVTVAGVGSQPPFTAAQWKELEHQALIYKYLVAGFPVPPDLLLPIRTSLESLSASFFQNPSLAYSSCYGKKFDPEPGRCRRTDGKKWRCSKDAYPDSKYCERHMHRSRNRSRKLVESQSTSQSSSHVIPNVPTRNSGGSAGLQTLPLQFMTSTGNSFAGSNASKLQTGSVPCGITSKEYFDGPNSKAMEYNFSSEASGGARINSNISSTWHHMPSQFPVNSSYEQSSDAYLENNSFPVSKQSELSSQGHTTQEHNPLRSFLDEWPNARDSWSDLADQRSNKNMFSTTHLSISNVLDPSDFSTRSFYSSKDA